jgi:protein-L-isoaspartate(D-aspartate) O-methyltransferase
MKTARGGDLDRPPIAERPVLLYNPSSSPGFVVEAWRRFVLAIVVLAGVASGGCEEKGPSPTAANSELLLVEKRRAFAQKLADGGIHDRRVIDAFAMIPRHRFVPECYLAESYQNRAFPIAEGQTTSQPSVVARMLELLELEGSERVLEVGTGSGYQAALLGRLVAEVYTIEIRDRLAADARRLLGELRDQGLITSRKVEVIEGDGTRGHPIAAPFDCIIVNAASSDVPPALFEQLRPGGRLVMPVGNRVQELEIIHKEVDGSPRRESHDVVRFRPLEDP